MERININNIDMNNSYFTFTRAKNIPSIEKMGLTTNPPNRENMTSSDKGTPAIYFSKGFAGLLKTADVFIRWEYDQMARKMNFPTGDEIIYPSVMKKVFEKFYNDERTRNFIKIDLIEGKNPYTSDFSSDELDFKKIRAAEKGYINSPNMIWEYGKYSDLNSMRMEDWNMYTHIGHRIIKPNKLLMMEDTKGNTDALSILLEVYDKMKDQDIGIDNLDEFVNFVKNKEKDIMER